VLSKPLTIAVPTVARIRNQIRLPGTKVRMPRPRNTQMKTVSKRQARKMVVSGRRDFSMGHYWDISWALALNRGRLTGIIRQFLAGNTRGGFYRLRMPARMPAPIDSSTTAQIAGSGTRTLKACSMSTIAIMTSKIPAIYRKIVTPRLGECLTPCLLQTGNRRELTQPILTWGCRD